MKTSPLVVMLLVALSGSLVFAFPIPKAAAVSYPTTIGVIDSYTTTYPTKAHTFEAFGLLWATYVGDLSGIGSDNYRCQTSSDMGATWSSPVALAVLPSPFGTGGTQGNFDDYYDAATHTLVMVYSNNFIVYRSAQLSAGGCAAISYNAPYVELNFSAYWFPPSNGLGIGAITVDSSNHAWVTFEAIGGDFTPVPAGCPVECWMTVEDSQNVISGNWLMAARPVVMSHWAVSEVDAVEIVPTGTGLTFLSTNSSTHLITIKTYSGGTWKPNVNIGTALTTGCEIVSPPCLVNPDYAWSAMPDAAGNVHIVYNGDDGFLHYTIYYPANNSIRADFELNGGSSFAQINYAYPAIDINGSNVYAFWVNENTTYVQSEISGVWDSATSLFTDGFFHEHTTAYPDGIVSSPMITSQSQDFVGGLYMIQDGHAKFFYLAASSPPSEPTVMVETNPIDLKNAITVNGVLYADNAIAFNVPNGTVLDLKAAGTALKMPGFLVYTFVSWSQGGLQDQSYTVTGNATLIADYTNGASSACAAYSGSGFNALEQQLNHGCEWSVVFYSWFGLFGPWILAFVDFLPALAIYLRTENPGAAIGVYVLIDVVLVYGMTAASMPASINTVAPGLLGAVIAGGIFQLLRSGKGG
jgi:hypothetical protein